MKKIFVFSALMIGLAGLVPNVANADKQTCQIRENDTCDNDNEYLSIDGVRGCYVCESGKCVTGDLVVATNARVDGKSYRNNKFRCQLGWDDQWIASPIPNCPAKWQKVKDDDHAKQKIINPDTGEPMFNDNSSQVVTGADPCLAWICDKGYQEVNGVCVPKSAPTPQPAPNPGNCTEGTTKDAACTDSQKQEHAATCLDQCINGTWKTAIKTCQSNYECIQHNDGIGCKECRKRANGGGNGGGHSVSCAQRRCGSLTGEQKAACVTCCAVPSSVAVWQNGICQCADTSKKFNPANLQCETQTSVVPPVVTPTYDCDAVKLAKVRAWRTQYASSREIVSAIDMLLEYCTSNSRNETTFNIMYSEIEDLIRSQAAAEESAAEAAARMRVSRGKISDASATLARIKNSLETSVWKNKDGKFNTSRLASDSVAAVVLGTAGGLITSNVIKKNQIKGGFEDINCTVGGQVVAGWGDEFRVGIQ